MQLIEEGYYDKRKGVYSRTINNMPVESVLVRWGYVEGHLLTSDLRGIEGMILWMPNCLII